MPIHFDLIITADHPNLTANFRLLDGSGVQLACQQTAFNHITVSHQQGLFDLSDFLRGQRRVSSLPGCWFGCNRKPASIGTGGQPLLLNETTLPPRGDS